MVDLIEFLHCFAVRAGNRFQPKGKKASVRSTSTTTLIDDGKKQKAVSQPSDVEHPVQPVADAGEMGKKTVDDLPVSVPLQVSGVKEDVIHSEKVSGEVRIRFCVFFTVMMFCCRMFDYLPAFRMQACFKILVIWTMLLLILHTKVVSFEYLLFCNI